MDPDGARLDAILQKLREESREMVAALGRLQATKLPHYDVRRAQEIHDNIQRTTDRINVLTKAVREQPECRYRHIW